MFFSVADPGCLSQIPDPDFYPSRIPDPGSRISDLGSRISDPGSRIPDPKTAMKNRGEKKLLSYLFFGAINFTKLNYFVFEMLKKKKIGAIFKELTELFTQKIVTKLSKILFGIRDPGSGKNLFRIPDPGSRGQKGTGSRIRIRNTGVFVNT